MRVAIETPGSHLHLAARVLLQAVVIDLTLLREFDSFELLNPPLAEGLAMILGLVSQQRAAECPHAGEHEVRLDRNFVHGRLLSAIAKQPIQQVAQRAYHVDLDNGNGRLEDFPHGFQRRRDILFDEF